jgi:hypothetical protein
MPSEGFRTKVDSVPRELDRADRREAGEDRTGEEANRAGQKVEEDKPNTKGRRKPRGRVEPSSTNVVDSQSQIVGTRTCTALDRLGSARAVDSMDRQIDSRCRCMVLHSSALADSTCTAVESSEVSRLDEGIRLHRRVLTGNDF